MLNLHKRYVLNVLNQNRKDMRGKVLYGLGFIVLLACTTVVNASVFALNKGEEAMENRELYLLVGTYTQKDSKGIYVYRFNTLTGEAEYVSMAEVENPSFLTANQEGNLVYAVTENGGNPSYANALSFDKKTGKLTWLNREETKGASPCNIALSPDGKQVVTANYGGGSISVFPVKADGALLPVAQVMEFKGQSVLKGRQDKSHLHCVEFYSDGKYLFATDLGADKIYRLETALAGKGDFIKEESLTSFQVKEGSGPRHIVMHPSGRFLYLINELSGTVTVFNYADGILEEIQTIIADDLHAQGSGDIDITPDGQYLYASNRLKGDGVAIFSINKNNGELSRTGYQLTGVHPRNIAVAPGGEFLLVANRDSDTVEVYRIARETGLLQNMEKNIQISMPVCLLFLIL